MKKQKKSLKQRLLSLLLFLSITWLVFNVETIFHKAQIFLGFTQIDFHEISKNDLDFDDELNHRPIVMGHKEHIVVSFSNEITIYDFEGNLIAKSEVTSDDSQIIGLPDYFVIVDKIQGHLSILDYFGNIVGTVYSLGPIKEMIEAPDNTIAVITETNDLLVYDHQGALLSNITLPAGELLSLDLSTSEGVILTNILDSDENRFTSKLLSYDMHKFVLRGANNNYDRIVYGAKFVNDLIIIVDDAGQMAFKEQSVEEKLWENKREGSLTQFKIDKNGNIFEIIAYENIEALLGTTDYRLVGRNQDGQLLFNKKLEHDYEKMSLQGGQILLQSDEDVLILDSSGELVKQFESTRKIVSSQWLSSQRILVEYNDYFTIYELKY